jgi:type IV pilus assembly protein PilA
MTKLRKMFLYHLNLKKCNKGITLIELLVVLFVIGFLSAIALPVFLKQVNKARETEATCNIDYLMKQQNAYYHEENIFTDSLNDIGSSSQAKTENYVYKIMLFPRDNPKVAAHFALSKKPNLSSYVGALYLKDKSPYPQLCKPFPIPNTPIRVMYPMTDQELVNLYYSRPDWESFCK